MTDFQILAASNSLTGLCHFRHPTYIFSSSCEISQPVFVERKEVQCNTSALRHRLSEASHPSFFGELIPQCFILQQELSFIIAVTLSCIPARLSEG